MMDPVERLNRRSKGFLMALSLGCVAIVGLVDFLTGFEIYFFSIYLIPVSLAAWYIGRGFGFFISVLCVAASAYGDLKAGARYTTFVLVWNAIIALAFYFVVVWILSKLRALQNELEERVRQRTAALNAEMQERMRLEEETLRISEREQIRIGHDLHDSLCQHLTGIALAGQVLSEQLNDSPPQAKAVNHIVELIEDAIELTRRLARGLHPVDMKNEGFMDALQELAANINERFKVSCRFECPIPVSLPQPGAAIHLYRIAQEAINNAIKHGKARNIVIRLEEDADAVRLTVTDDGVGLPGNPRGGKGMGLRIMAYRASMIGGSFDIERLPGGGTSVVCSVPAGAVASPENYAPEKQRLSS
jgi:signal transduction histidine kinase